jgi:CubicO group peptidase (beta-lactamase class C family)
MPEAGSAVDAGSGDAGSAGECDGGQARFDSLVQQMTAAIQAAKSPGAAVAVVCNGRLAYTAGIGVVKQGGAAVTPNTRFQLASQTKMFTAAAAVWLEEQGKVDLTAPIGATLPQLAYGQITLHQLLTHTAGFTTQFPVDNGGSLALVIDANATLTLWAPPGAVWNYSNPGFSVAGRVLEVASGTDFADLVEQRIFAPAHMDRATMKVSRVLSEGDYAFGHGDNPDSPTVFSPDGSYYGTGSYGPMGGAWASVVDLAAWSEFLMQQGAGVISPSGIASLTTSQTKTTYFGTGYGYGHFVDTDTTPKVVRYEGSVQGFVSEWLMVPDAGFAVAVLQNSEWGPSFEHTITNAYVPVTQAPPPTIDLTEYVGTYFDPYEFETVQITVQGTTVHANFVDRNQQADLQPVDIDDYLANYSPVNDPTTNQVDINFWHDPGQPASYIVSLWGVAARK